MNNPISYCDPSGHFIISTAVIAGLIVGALEGMIISNIISIISKNIYVNNSNVEAMTELEIEEINKRKNTLGLSQEEKLAYIRGLRKQSSSLSKNWSEAEMLREFNYHDKWYYFTKFFGSDENKKDSLANRFKYVNFETEQTFSTYVKRFIGTGAI